MRLFRCWWLAAVLALPALPSFALEVPLTYVTRDVNQGRFFYARQRPDWSTSPMEGITSLPKFNAAKPMFATLTLGDTTILMALDRPSADEKAYTKLYIDRNGNRDLTDDPVIEGEITRPEGNATFAQVNFPVVDVEYTLGEKTLPYRMRVFLYFQNLTMLDATLASDQRIENAMYGYAEGLCDYEAKIPVGDTTWNLAFVDQNMDGRFVPTTQRPPEYQQAKGITAYYPTGDQVFVGANDQWDYNDRQVLGELLAVAGGVFKVGLDLKADKLTMEPIEEGLVTVGLPDNVERLTLFSENPIRIVSVYCAGKPLALPGDAYRLLEYQIRQKDEQGDMWRLEANGTTDMKPLDLKSGEASLAVGEPIQMKVDAQASNRSVVGVLFNREKVTASLDFVMRDCSGALITDLAHESGNKTKIKLAKENPQRPKEPAYVVALTDGEVLTQGDFRYG